MPSPGPGRSFIKFFSSDRRKQGKNKQKYMGNWPIWNNEVHEAFAILAMKGSKERR